MNMVQPMVHPMDSHEYRPALLVRQHPLAADTKLIQQKCVDGQKRVWQEYHMVRQARLAQQDILDQQKSKMVQLEASIAQKNDIIVQLRLVATSLDQAILSFNTSVKTI